MASSFITDHGYFFGLITHHVNWIFTQITDHDKPLCHPVNSTARYHSIILSFDERICCKLAETNHIFNFLQVFHSVAMSLTIQTYCTFSVSISLQMLITGGLHLLAVFILV